MKNLKRHGEVNRPTMGVTLLDLRSIPAQQQREMLKLPNDVTEGVVVNEVIPQFSGRNAGVQTI